MAINFPIGNIHKNIFGEMLDKLEKADIVEI